MQIKILIQQFEDQLAKIVHTDMRRTLMRHLRTIIFLAFIFVIAVVYFMTLRPARRLAADAVYWEKQAALAKSLLSGTRSENEVINILKSQAERTQRLIILSQDTDIVQIVKTYAQRMNVRLLNVTTDASAKAKWGQAVKINSRLVRMTTVQIQAEAGFVNLVRYFDTLYRVAPAVVSVEKLTITGGKKDPERLRASIELRFYSIQDEKK